MKFTRLFTLSAALALSSQISFAQIASDNAGNYGSGFTNGANGGSGFGSWQINSSAGSGAAGTFIAGSNPGGITGMGAQSFGFYANPNNSGAFVTANRSFSSGGLTNGQTFSFKWGVNYDSGVEGNKGFSLFRGGTSGAELVNINNGGSQDITLNGANVNFGYGANAMTWSFTQLSPTVLRITANDRDGNGAFTTNLVVNGRVDSFRIYASQMQPGDAAQPYFNDFAVTAAVDADSDGMPDEWELAYFGNTTSQVANGDADNDGLQNLAEFNAGTIPNLADTDGDGLKDGFEAANSGYQVVLGSFTWDTARRHAIAKGGHLATITSAAEKNAIAAAVTSAEMTELWLGASRTGTTWGWVTGETWDESAYNNWMPGEPGNTDGQNYLRLKTFAEGWDNWFATPTADGMPVTIRGYLLEKNQATDPTKFNHPLITVASSFQGWNPQPFPANAPANVMTPGTGTNQFVRSLDFSFPTTVNFVGKYANGEVFSSSNNINWGTSGTAGVAQRGGGDIPFNVTSTGWWTFTFNTDTLSYGFARKTFDNYLAYAAAYNLPPAGSGGGESEDYEGDGLTNGQEFAANTNPNSADTDEDFVPDSAEATAGTSPLLADTDGDTLPDWWELTVGLNALSATGADGALGNPDGDLFSNRQEYDGQSNPLDVASVPANRSVTFSLNLNRQINAGTFLTNSHTVEVWGSFNDWGNFTNKFSLTNNGSGIYTATHTVAGAAGATNFYKYVTFPSSNNAVWEDGNNRPLVMGADGVAITNLPTAYLGEVRPVSFSVNMGVQVALGLFSHSTNHKVYVVGQDVEGGWNTGTELSRVGATDVYAGAAFVSGAEGATNVPFKFRVSNALGYEGDLDPNDTDGNSPRRFTLAARDVTQTVSEVFFNNVTNVPANRTVTFAVNMNAQTNTNKISFDLASSTVEVRFFGPSATYQLTNNGSGIFTGSFPLVGAEGTTNNYKYVALVGTNTFFERVDLSRTNSLLNRTFVLGPTNTPQTVHSAASPALFSNDDGVGPVITLKGANPLNLTNGAVFTDPGATAADDAEGTSVDITGSGTVNTSVAGSYTVTYSASDAAGNAATPVTRTVVVAASGSTFAGAYPGQALTNVAPNGRTYLVNYAFGGSSSNAPTWPVQDTSDTNYLTLVAYVRTNHTGSTLTVLGEKASSLNSWDTNNPIDATVPADQTGAPEGTQKRIYSVIKSGNRQFLRLRVTDQP